MITAAKPRGTCAAYGPPIYFTSAGGDMKYGPIWRGQHWNPIFQGLMDRAEALRRVTEARVGRFATTRPDGRPHLVPVTFAVLGSILVHMIDHKPKTTDRLQRLANLDSDGRVSLLVDHYEDSWDRLWWVRVDGHATVVTKAGAHV